MSKQEQFNQLARELMERKAQLLAETDANNELLNELKGERVADDCDFAEVACDSHNISAIREKHRIEILEIDHALKKIEDGTYGVCEMCDEKISIGRLRAKPHAKFCTECRPIYEKSLQNRK